jgi:hypothetical protein
LTAKRDEAEVSLRSRKTREKDKMVKCENHRPDNGLKNPNPLNCVRTHVDDSVVRGEFGHFLGGSRPFFSVFAVLVVHLAGLGCTLGNLIMLVSAVEPCCNS